MGKRRTASSSSSSCDDRKKKKKSRKDKKTKQQGATTASAAKPSSSTASNPNADAAKQKPDLASMFAPIKSKAPPPPSVPSAQPHPSSATSKDEGHNKARATTGTPVTSGAIKTTASEEVTATAHATSSGSGGGSALDMLAPIKCAAQPQTDTGAPRSIYDDVEVDPVLLAEITRKAMDAQKNNSSVNNATTTTTHRGASSISTITTAAAAKSMKAALERDEQERLLEQQQTEYNESLAKEQRVEQLAEAELAEQQRLCDLAARGDGALPLDEMHLVSAIEKRDGDETEKTKEGRAAIAEMDPLEAYFLDVEVDEEEGLDKHGKADADGQQQHQEFVTFDADAHVVDLVPPDGKDVEAPAAGAPRVGVTTTTVSTTAVDDIDDKEAEDGKGKGGDDQGDDGDGDGDGDEELEEALFETLLNKVHQSATSSTATTVTATATSTALTVFGDWDASDDSDDDDDARRPRHGDSTRARRKTKKSFTNAKTINMEMPKGKELKPVDHASVHYIPFEKDFFIPTAEAAKMTPEEIHGLYKQLDGAKVHAGSHQIPPPIKEWNGIGLNETCLDILEEHFPRPFAIQSLAVPVLMAGRDLLAIAKTGSGKTLAYVLPLIRHAMNQPRCLDGEGPIGLIVLPTHELAVQVFKVVNLFAQRCRLRAVAAFGGINLGENIRDCKKGFDIMVVTPGRLFDLLLANRGKVMNLSRVSYFVVDETDRMFDEGFGPFVVAFLRNIRPDRQIAMVSSTMPKEVKRVVVKILAHNHVELSIGGRPSPSSNVKQHVDFFDDYDDTTVQQHHQKQQQGDPRWRRLLALLGEFCNESSGKLVIVFVRSQADCDRLYARLESYGYQGKVGTLYSGMDELEREVAIKRFNRNDHNILIATSVAERGIDVLDLDLVVNYTLPDHFEAYVNRIGRTGRAGRKGVAHSFFVRGVDDMLARDLVQGLEASGSAVPDELHQICQRTADKIKAGLIKKKTGYSMGFKHTKGFKFNPEERRAAREALGIEGGAEGNKKREHDGSGSDEDDMNSDEEVLRKRKDPRIFSTNDREAPSRALVVVNNSGGGASAADGGDASALASRQLSALEAARKRAQQVTEEARAAAASGSEGGSGKINMLESRYDINDYSVRVRSKLTNRKFLDEVQDETDASITVCGVYTDPTRRAHVGQDSKLKAQNKLHLLICSEKRENITRIFRKFDDVIDEITLKDTKKRGAFGAIKLPGMDLE